MWLLKVRNYNDGGNTQCDHHLFKSLDDAKQRATFYTLGTWDLKEIYPE